MMPSFRHFFTRALRGDSRGAVEQAAVFRWCATSTRAARDRGRVVVASAAVAFMGWVWWLAVSCGTPVPAVTFEAQELSHSRPEPACISRSQLLH